ncbi:MAG: hypothetical protein ACLPN5_16695, partial [Roseiarcus sp.]
KRFAFPLCAATKPSRGRSPAALDGFAALAFCGGDSWRTYFAASRERLILTRLFQAEEARSSFDKLRMRDLAYKGAREIAPVTAIGFRF